MKSNHFLTQKKTLQRSLSKNSRNIFNDSSTLSKMDINQTMNFPDEEIDDLLTKKAINRSMKMNPTKKVTQKVLKHSIVKNPDELFSFKDLTHFPTTDNYTDGFQDS